MAGAAADPKPTARPVKTDGPYPGATQVPRGFPVSRTPQATAPLPPDAVVVEIYLGVHAPLPAVLAQTAARALPPGTTYYLVAPTDTMKSAMRHAAAHQCLASQWSSLPTLHEALTDTLISARERFERLVPLPVRPALAAACPLDGVASRWYNEIISNRIRLQRLTDVDGARAMPLLRVVRSGQPPQLWPLATRTAWPRLAPTP